MNYTLIADATVEPLDLAEVYTWLKDPSEDESDLIQGLITSARQLVERENGRNLAVKTWELALDCWPGCDYIELLDPLKVVAPATSAITSFTYKTSTGATTALVEGTDFHVDASQHPPIVHLPYSGQWPTATLWPHSAIKIRFTAGLAATDVPRALKQYMQFLITGWYEKRIPFDTSRDEMRVTPFVTNLANVDRLYK